MNSSPFQSSLLRLVGTLPAHFDDKRVARRRRQRETVLGRIFMHHLIDTALLAALAGLGRVSLVVVLCFLLQGLVLCSAMRWVMNGGAGDPLRDHWLATPQMLFAATANLAFAVWVPQVGVLLMMGVFVTFAFGALRLNTTWALVNCAVMAVQLMGVVLLVGDRLGLPLDTWPERVVSGVWLALLLGRSASVGYMGSRVQRLLVKRNRELAAMSNKLDVLAHRDELTHALNRRSVMRALAEEHQRYARHRSAYCIALLDLDHFKQINDTHGHAVGDDVLRRMTEVCKREMRAVDCIGRYGGEEFLCIFTATADAGAAMMAAERLRLGVCDEDWSQVAADLKVTVSIGLALSQPDEPLEQFLSRADEALYAAKREGRNRIRIG